MHFLAVVVVPFDRERAEARPLTARDAAISAVIETLMFRYQQPDDDWAWGVDSARGFHYDWWQVGGRWAGWGFQMRRLMKKQRISPLPRTVPRFLNNNAVWSDDLGRVRLSSSSLLPVAIVTPHGEWEEWFGNWGFGKSSARQRKLKAAWLRRIRMLTRAYPGCLAVAGDCHC